MRPLSGLRIDERGTARLEAAATQTLTVAESVAAFRALYAAFAADLDATEHLCRADREQHLRALQARLRRLEDRRAAGRP